MLCLPTIDMVSTWAIWAMQVLMLDDYYDISEKVLRQAYVEALYRADEVYERSPLL